MRHEGKEGGEGGMFLGWSECGMLLDDGMLLGWSANALCIPWGEGREGEGRGGGRLV